MKLLANKLRDIAGLEPVDEEPEPEPESEPMPAGDDDTASDDPNCGRGFNP